MLNRPLFSSFFLPHVFAFACLALVFPLPVQAGFQWVPPTAVGEIAPQQAPAMVIEGTPPPSSAVSSPPVTRAPQTLQLPRDMGSSSSTGSLSSPVGSTDGKALLPSDKAAVGKDKVVRGFANNVPLAVALRQILPPEYGFSVGQDVQLSTLVSWQGGRTWRPILEDMLRSAGLVMREEGTMVQIVRSSAPPSLSTQSALSPSAPGPAPSLQPPADTKPLPLVPSSAMDNTLQLPPAAYPSRGTMSVPIPQTSPVDSWTANRGETLHKVLESWSRRANVELSWQAEYDYPLQASITMTGTFEDAVRGLLLGFQEAQPQPVGFLHNNASAGQTILVVQTRGNNYSE